MTATSTPIPTLSLSLKDLTTIPGVQTYLRNTPFASHTITPLAGGTANFAYRLHLDAPFEGEETLVLKHAQPYVKDFEGMRFGLERQTFEAEAMRRVKAWAAVDSVVTVPKVHRFDKEYNAIVMEDCGDDVLTLKDFLRQSSSSSSSSSSTSTPACTPALARAIGTSLGHFLGSMHTWSRTNPGEILDFFGTNQQAKTLSAWATYGRLVSTLTLDQGEVLPRLSDPPIEVDDRVVGVLGELAERMRERMLGATEVFVMGDFWPGNIMVKLDTDRQLKRLYILDWELAKPGLPGVEIGQFCAEVDLLRRFVPSSGEAPSIILSTFLEAYSLSSQDTGVGRDALTHWGVHLAVWTPRVEWGGKEKTREIVQEGVQLLMAAAEGSDEDLRKSLVGPLVPKD